MALPDEIFFELWQADELDIYHKYGTSPNEEDARISGRSLAVKWRRDVLVIQVTRTWHWFRRVDKRRTVARWEVEATTKLGEIDPYE